MKSGTSLNEIEDAALIVFNAGRDAAALSLAAFFSLLVSGSAIKKACVRRERNGRQNASIVSRRSRAELM